MTDHHPLPLPASIADQALLAITDLACLARHARFGVISAGTVLAFTARLQQKLRTLAEYEAALDELTIDALDAERARAQAIAAGAVVQIPTRPRRVAYHGGGGGSAA